MRNFILHLFKVLIKHLAKKSGKNIERFSNKVQKHQFWTFLGLIGPNLGPFGPNEIFHSTFVAIFGIRGMRNDGCRTSPRRHRDVTAASPRPWKLKGMVSIVLGDTRDVFNVAGN